MLSFKHFDEMFELGYNDINDEVINKIKDKNDTNSI